jgi:hypothetical protein
MREIVFVGKLTSYGKRGYVIYIPEEVQSKYSDVLKELWGKPVVVEIKELAGVTRGVLK